MFNDILNNKIKEKLKVKNPNISSEELEVATKEIVDNINSKKKVDEDGHIIVAENVKVIIPGAISSATEIKD